MSILLALCLLTLVLVFGIRAVLAGIAFFGVVGFGFILLIVGQLW